MLSDLLKSVPVDLARQIREEFAKLARENDTVRAILGKSDLPCVYCGLPWKEMGKCSHGFPGCPRADDIMLDPRESVDGPDPYDTWKPIE